jgi:hypothetical protein
MNAIPGPSEKSLTLTGSFGSLLSEGDFRLQSTADFLPSSKSLRGKAKEFDDDPMDKATAKVMKKKEWDKKGYENYKNKLLNNPEFADKRQQQLERKREKANARYEEKKRKLEEADPVELAKHQQELAVRREKYALKKAVGLKVPTEKDLQKGREKTKAYREKLKIEDPEKYEELLEKDRIRNRQRYHDKKAKSKKTVWDDKIFSPSNVANAANEDEFFNQDELKEIQTIQKNRPQDIKAKAEKLAQQQRIKQQKYWERLAEKNPEKLEAMKDKKRKKAHARYHARKSQTKETVSTDEAIRRENQESVSEHSMSENDTEASTEASDDEYSEYSD